MNVFIQFKAEGDAINGRLYNIEQVNVFHSNTALKTGSIGVNNFETLGPVGLVNQQYRYTLRDNSDGVSAMDQSDMYFPLPLFLGASAPVPSLSAAVQFGVNNIDLTQLTVTIQGYIWEPRSLLAAGGLRRPTDSLYGAGRG